MTQDTPPTPTCPHCGKALELGHLAERIADAHERLGSLLQILAGKPLPGGLVVGRAEPHSETQQAAFAMLVEKYKGGEALLAAVREAGYELIALPEAVYGAFSPSELL